jgi:hypothetical protein
MTCVGREGVDRDRRPELELMGAGACSVAVAEEAVVEDIEASSRVAGWPYWTSGATNERGRVCVARSKPATAESRPVRKVVACEVVSVRILEPVSFSSSFAEAEPLRRGASEKGPRPCHI